MTKIASKTHRKYCQAPCSGVVKQITLQQLREFTSMSLGTIFDRIIEGKGILTTRDQYVLDLANELYRKLTKLAIPKTYSEEIWSLLNRYRDYFKTHFSNLIKELEQGTPIIYYRDFADMLNYKKEPIPFSEHRNEQKIVKNAFIDYFYNVAGIPPEELCEPRAFPKQYREMKKEITDRIKERHGNPKTTEDYNIKQEVFKEMYSVIKEYIPSIQKNHIEKLVFNPDFNPEPESAEEEASIESYSSWLRRLSYDDRYEYTTSYPEKANSFLFRKTVEGVCYVQTRASDGTVRLMQKDLKALDEFFNWKEKYKRLKSNTEPPGYTQKQMDIISDILGKIEIPSLPKYDINEQYVDVSDYLNVDYSPGYQHIVISGKTYLGLDLSIPMRITSLQKSLWTEKVEEILSWRNSADENKKQTFEDLKSLKDSDFLKKYYPNIDYLIQICCIGELKRILDNQWLGKFKLYSDPLPNYTILNLVDRERAKAMYSDPYK